MPTTDTLRLTLVRAPDDEASSSPRYQAECGSSIASPVPRAAK